MSRSLPTEFMRMDNAALYAHIKSTEERLKRMKKEFTAREGTTCWMCDVCGEMNTSSTVIVEHVKKEHGYPEEDANLVTIRVYL